MAVPADPYLILPLALLDTLVILRGVSAAGRESARRGAPLNLDARRSIARRLEAPALSIERSSGLSPTLGPGLNPDALSALEARGQGVVAWLRQLERDIMWPSSDAPDDVYGRVLKGLVGVRLGDWSSLEVDLPHRGRTRWLRKFLPRVAVAGALGAAAWLLPLALQNVITATASDTLRVVITAVSSLFAPAQALSDAANTVASAGKPGR